MVSILLLSTLFLLDFGIVPTVSYFFLGGGGRFIFNNAAILLNIILFDVSQRSCSCFGWLHY